MAEDIVKEARKRFRIATEAEGRNRNEALDDLRFSNGEQWPREVKYYRQMDNRPCLTLDRTDQFIRQMVNNWRETRPAIKIRGVDDKADKKSAETINGMIRAIEQSCNAESAYDWAVEYAIRGGWGYVTVDTEYEDPKSFYQCIVVRRVQNPFTIYLDPDHDEPDGSDARWGFEAWWEDKDDAKGMHPNAEWDETYASGTGREHWYAKGQVRLAKYWKIKETETKIYLMPDDTVLESGEEWKVPEEMEVGGRPVPAGALIPAEEAAVSERSTTLEKVRWYLMNGAEVLDEGDWAGKYIPIVLFVGEELDIEGERYRKGAVRRMKDPQRQYNYWRSAHTERVALAPLAPFIGPRGAFRNRKWRQANRRTFAYLEYEPEAVNKVGGSAAIPQRSMGSQISSGDVHEQQVAADDLHAISGMHQPGQMDQQNERSGRAVFQRQMVSDKANMHYIDNGARSIRHVGRILVDLIPKIYSSERVVTIVEGDGEESQVPINAQQQNPNQEPPVDIRVGKYDATVDIGPSYATQRQEAQAFLIQIMRHVEGAGPMIADLMAKYSDAAGADEIAERLKALLPAEMLAKDNPEFGFKLKEMQQKMQAMGQQYEQLLDEYKKLKMENKNKAGELALKIAEAKRDGKEALLKLREEARQHDDEVFLKAVEMELKHVTDIAGVGLEAEKLNQPEGSYKGTLRYE